MESSVQELLDMLYAMIRDAYQVPLGAGRCIIEKDKLLDLMDEIKAQLPTELEEARRLVATRSEYVGNAKREAESMLKVAEDRARQMVDREEVVRNAKAKANSIISTAESKSAELRRVANAYTDDVLQRTETAINEAMNEVHQARAKFKNVSAAAMSHKPDIVPEDNDI